MPSASCFTSVHAFASHRNYTPSCASSVRIHLTWVRLLVIPHTSQAAFRRHSLLPTMGIGSIFRHTPNHVKLVRDCYPHSKTAVEPDSNSLGKLTFYTKRRPIKLSKVGRALLSRSQKSSESIGHLCVTLTILKKLLAECRNDVNVFSKEAIAIINIAFNRAQTFSRAFQTNPHTLLELYEKTADAVSFYSILIWAMIVA